MTSSNIDHDDVICDVAARIVDKADMEKFGKKLHFQIHEIQTFHKNNHAEGKVTNEGTKDMIREWQKLNVKTRADFWPLLSKALLDARLLKIVGDIEQKYPGLEPEEESPGPGPTPKVQEDPVQPRNQVPVQKDLEDGNILAISSHIPVAKYKVLCDKLGVSSNEAGNILYRLMNDVAGASTEVMVAWKTANGHGPKERQALQRILVSAGLGDLADRL